jgi:hypothetical protein
MEPLLSIQVHGYNRETGAYVGTVTAWENPVARGTYLLPADSTQIEPPAFQDGKVRVFNGTAWVYEDAPASSSSGASETPEQMAYTLRQLRNSLLAVTDYTQLQDVPISSSLRAEFYNYRVQLRNLPQQPGWPTNVVWPVAPTYQKS